MYTRVCQLERCQLQLVKARGYYNCRQHCTQHIPNTEVDYSFLLGVAMAARSPHFTASQVGDLVTGEDDTEFLLPVSDDDFDAGLLDDEQDPLDREQGKLNKHKYAYFTNTLIIIESLWCPPAHSPEIFPSSSESSPEPSESSPEPSAHSHSERETCSGQNRGSHRGRSRQRGNRGRSHSGRGSGRGTSHRGSNKRGACCGRTRGGRGSGERGSGRCNAAALEKIE